MVGVVTLLGVLMLVIGLMGLVSPESLRDLASWFRTPGRFYAGLTVRLVLGILLILAAPACRASLAWLVRAVGVLAVASAAVLLMIGRDRRKAFVAWWLVRSGELFRLSAAVSLLLGLLLIAASAGLT